LDIDEMSNFIANLASGPCQLEQYSTRIVEISPFVADGFSLSIYVSLHPEYPFNPFCKVIVSAFIVDIANILIIKRNSTNNPGIRVYPD